MHTRNPPPFGLESRSTGRRRYRVAFGGAAQRDPRRTLDRANPFLLSILLRAIANQRSTGIKRLDDYGPTNRETQRAEVK